MKRQRTLVLLVAAMLAGNGRSGAATLNGRFVIGGWYIGDNSNPSRLVRMGSAGLDFVVNGDRFDELEARRTVAALDSLTRVRAGFTLRVVLAYRNTNADDAISFQRHARRRRDAMVARFGPQGGWLSSSVAGWMVWDEPLTEDDFENIDSTLQVLASIPGSADRFPLVNLLPLHASAQPGFRNAWGDDPEAGYAHYLDRYFQLFAAHGRTAPLVSFDLYPFETGTQRNDVFLNLTLVHEAAVRASPSAPVPLWMLVQLSPSRDNHGRYRLTPDMARVRWQVHAALLYGAKGIHYFTLVPSGPGNFGPGMLDGRGRPTARYDSLRTFHQRLHAIGGLLAKQPWVSVIHESTLGQTGIEGQVATSAGAANDLVAGLTSAGQVAAAAHFGAPDSATQYVLVMNKGLDRAADVTVTLARPPSRVERYSAGGWSALTSGSGGFELKSIAPGDVALCRVTLP